MNYLAALKPADQPAVATPYDGTIPTFTGKYAANDTWAHITRQQWQDYLQRFAPREEEMIGMTTYANPGIVNQEVAKAGQAAKQAVQNYGGMSRQYLSRYGMQLDPRATAQTERMEKLTSSAAEADAANRTRQTLQDQNRQIAFGMAAAGANPNTPQ